MCRFCCTVDTRSTIRKLDPTYGTVADEADRLADMRDAEVSGGFSATNRLFYDSAGSGEILEIGFNPTRCPQGRGVLWDLSESPPKKKWRNSNFLATAAAAFTTNKIFAVKSTTEMVIIDRDLGEVEATITGTFGATTPMRGIGTYCYVIHDGEIRRYDESGGVSSTSFGNTFYALGLNVFYTWDASDMVVITTGDFPTGTNYAWGGAGTPLGTSAAVADDTGIYASGAKYVNGARVWNVSPNGATFRVGTSLFRVANPGGGVVLYNVDPTTGADNWSTTTFNMALTGDRDLSGKSMTWGLNSGGTKLYVPTTSGTREIRQIDMSSGTIDWTSTADGRCVAGESGGPWTAGARQAT